ncbi:MAG: salicylate hydroxylase [Celeribacter sp.]|jgi:salicylate hydroxylase
MLIGQDIAILGAGVAGLAAARALALRGARVTVYERAPAITEVGAGLQLSPNGVAVLSALGLDAASVAMRSQGVLLVDGYLGRTVLHMDFNRYKPESAFLLIHRADLIDLLAQGARDAGVQIKLSRIVDTVVEDSDRVTITFEDGSRTEHDVVIGADGLQSRLRKMLNGDAAPFFTGQTAWRATVPAVGGEDPVAMVHVAAGKHVVCYPLRQGTMINIVAVEERADWTAEGWHHTGDPAQLTDHFSEFGGGVTSLLARVTEVSRWGLFRHPVAQNWHGTRTALIGDAAHPTLPFLAQGANLALEDAWVLADCLASLPYDQALPAYQSRRQLRVKRVIDAATANARNYHLRGAKRGVAHMALRLGGAIAPQAVIDKFSWLYDHDVTAG